MRRQFIQVPLKKKKSERGRGNRKWPGGLSRSASTFCEKDIMDETLAI